MTVCSPMSGNISTSLEDNNIQLMHSFNVNIRICQPEKVMSIEASAHNLYFRA